MEKMQVQRRNNGGAKDTRWNETQKTTNLYKV